jgi:hypothetical protein
MKNFLENIVTYAPEGSFTEEEKITFLSDLTGIFPVSKVVTPEFRQGLMITSFHRFLNMTMTLKSCWCIPRSVTTKTTKNGKKFFVVEVVDSNSVVTKVRCWGITTEIKQQWSAKSKKMYVREKDEILLNRPYALRPRYSADWGFSTMGATKNSWFLLG